jgi:CheY-like chemotaxis protein
MKIRILMFEDETAILRPICTFLRAQGYEVLGFNTPKACPLLSDSKHECPHDQACADILITDMNMPEMTGYELIRTLARKGCGIPLRNIIVISSTMPSGQREEIASLGSHFLPKPFQLGALLRVIRDCNYNIDPSRELIPIETLSNSMRPISSATGI